MLRTLIAKLSSFLDRLSQEQPVVPVRKALAISLGVGAILFIIVFINRAYGSMSSSESMVLAVFGVSALCIFLFPDSKLYSPFIILEANLLATSIAFVSVYLFSNLTIGIIFASFSTILGLYLLGCMHPPALFLAIVLVIAKVDSLNFAFYPVFVDSLMLTLASYLYRQYLKNAN
jgi:CBS domain-containing membrane protein